MKKRQESKIRTRELILGMAKDVYTEKGIINTPTAEIAQRCGLAHGSIFLHFGSKENLIFSVLEREIKRIALSLETECRPSARIEDVVDSYFDIVEHEEMFLSMLYRELPFLDDKLKREIIALETIVRNSFYLTIEVETREKKHAEAYITASLNSLFAALYYYLCLKDLFAIQGSVISQKRHEIKEIFLKTIR